MRYLARESGRFSDQQVWSAIRYLDPERNCQNASRPVLVPVIVFLTFWLIFLAAMYVLSVRVSHTGSLGNLIIREDEDRRQSLHIAASSQAAPTFSRLTCAVGLRIPPAGNCPQTWDTRSCLRIQRAGPLRNLSRNYERLGPPHSRFFTDP